MGNDEHSQNVYRRAREEGLDPLAVLRSDGAGVPVRLGPARRARTTTSSGRPSRAIAPRFRSSIRRIARGWRRLRGHLRGLVLHRLRSVQAGKGSGRRQMSAARRRRVDHREEPFLPAVGISRTGSSSISRRIRNFSSRTSGGTRSCVCSTRASRTSPSAGPASTGASRCPTIPTASSTSGSTR